MFVFISDHIVLLDFWKHLVILLLTYQIDIDIDHLIVLTIYIDSVESRMVIMVDQ